MTKLSDYLKVNLTVDPNSGNHIYTYSYKRKRCPTKLIPGLLSKQYIGYNLIMRDLKDAEAWLKQAYDFVPNKKRGKDKDGNNYYKGSFGDTSNEMIIKSLFFSSLIFYGKCFTQAKGRGIKLDKSFVPKQLREKHDQIMEYRHNLAAHAGIGRWETGKLKLVLPPKKGSNVNNMIKPELTRLNFEDDRMDEYRFLDLIQAVHKKAEEKKEKIGQKIFEDIIIPKGEDYWYKPPKKAKKSSKKNAP